MLQNGNRRIKKMKKPKLKKTPKAQFSNIAAVNYQTLSDEKLLFISDGLRDKLIITYGELIGITCYAVACYLIQIIIKNKDIKFEITQSAKDFILEKGTDIKFGARPLRRAIQRYIDDELSEMILKSELIDGTTVIVNLKNDKLEFKIK